ncbi:MAG: hypothetical protein DME20_03615, partial [Verrucomicrobia bacterium]
MNSQNAALSVEALNIEAERESAKRLFNALTVQRVNRSTNILVCQQNTENEIVCPARPGVRSWRHYQMTVNLPETTSKMEGPLVKQFSVFLPNKVGAMLEVVKLLNTQNTHVVALSVSESTDSAIARIIASDPARVEKLFREKNVPFGVSQVVVVE